MMMRLFYRQRRRLIGFALLACLPVVAMLFVFAWQNPVSYFEGNVVFALALGVVALWLCAAGMAIPLMIIAFFPRWRGIIEYTAIGVPLGIAYHPLANLISEAFAIQGWSDLVFFALVFGTIKVVTMKRVLPWKAFRAKASYRTQDTAFTVWSERAPDPAHLDRHWDTSLHAITLDRKDPDIRYATYKIQDTELKQRIIMDREDVGDGFSYDYANLAEDGTNAGTGHFSVDIKDLGFCREVCTEMRTEKLPFLQWLALWLDDILADEADYLEARALDQEDRTLCGMFKRASPKRPPAPPKPTLAEEMAALEALRETTPLAA